MIPEDLQDAEQILGPLAKDIESFAMGAELSGMSSSGEYKAELDGWLRCIKSVAIKWNIGLPRLPSATTMIAKGTVLDKRNEVVAISMENFVEYVRQEAQKGKNVPYSGREVLSLLEVDIGSFLNGAADGGRRLDLLRNVRTMLMAWGDCIGKVAGMWGTRSLTWEARITQLMSENNVSYDFVTDMQDGNEYGSLRVVAITVEGSPTNCFPLIDPKGDYPCPTAL